MQKPKLLIADSNLIQPWFMPLWQEFFDVDTYNHDQIYDPSSIVITDNRFGAEPQRYQRIKSRGYRVILSYLMDCDIHDRCKTINGELVLRARDWMWIQESLQWRHLNYHLPRESAVPSKFFLLLMNLKKSNRDDLYQAVTAYLESSMYSYVEHGITLPDDEFVPSPFNKGTANDRFYQPRWYAQTSFSLVSETSISAKLFISEKIFKPLAYQHPFIVYGSTHTLKYIRSLGFETFGHRINESYDSILNEGLFEAKTRLNSVIEILEDLHREFQQTGTVLQDARTQKILAHNHALFFDQTRVHDMFCDQVVAPIMEFVESL
jgi:hypothetical protein